MNFPQHIHNESRPVRGQRKTSAVKRRRAQWMRWRRFSDAQWLADERDMAEVYRLDIEAQEAAYALSCARNPNHDF